jgi:hypothetical protein
LPVSISNSTHPKAQMSVRLSTVFDAYDSEADALASFGTKAT